MMTRNIIVAPMTLLAILLFAAPGWSDARNKPGRALLPISFSVNVTVYDPKIDALRGWPMSYACRCEPVDWPAADGRTRWRCRDRFGAILYEGPEPGAFCKAWFGCAASYQARVDGLCFGGYDQPAYRACEEEKARWTCGFKAPEPPPGTRRTYHWVCIDRDGNERYVGERPLWEADLCRHLRCGDKLLP